ncbi:MAG: hypothetical protein V1809_10980 [Planctomycetota bacterium]
MNKKLTFLVGSLISVVLVVISWRLVWGEDNEGFRPDITFHTSGKFPLWTYYGLDSRLPDFRLSYILGIAVPALIIALLLKVLCRKQPQNPDNGAEPAHPGDGKPAPQP